MHSIVRGLTECRLTTSLLEQDIVLFENEIDSIVVVSVVFQLASLRQ